jgi:hypothetical protein
MMSTRLTSRDRIAIIRNAIEDSFGKRIDEMCMKERNLGTEIFNEKYSDEIRLKMLHIPQHLLNTRFSLDANICGFYVNLTMYSRPDEITESSLTRTFIEYNDVVIHRKVRYIPLPSQTISLDNVKIKEKFEDLNGEKQELKNDIVTAIVKLRPVIQKVSTLNSLKKVWPEGEIFYQFLNDKEPIINLPADMSEINKIFDVPR